MISRHTYASSRSIGKQEIWAEAPVDKNADKKFKHSNRGNKHGRKIYVQTIQDANGFIVKTIAHLTAHDVFALKRRKAKKQGYLKNTKNRHK